MEVTYRQDVNRSYMVIKKETGQVESFQEKMVLKNKIPGLLRMTMQSLNGEAYYCYDTRQLQTLEKEFEGKKISKNEVEGMLKGLTGILSELNRYLLKSCDLIVEPGLIYWNPEGNSPFFAYYPNSFEKVDDSYVKFAQFLIDHVDQDDEKALKLAYDYFGQVSDGIYCPVKRIQVDETDKKEVEKAPAAGGTDAAGEWAFENQADRDSVYGKGGPPDMGKSAESGEEWYDSLYD